MQYGNLFHFRTKPSYLPSIDTLLRNSSYIFLFLKVLPYRGKKKKKQNFFFVYISFDMRFLPNFNIKIYSLTRRCASCHTHPKPHKTRCFQISLFRYYFRKFSSLIYYGLAIAKMYYCITLQRFTTPTQVFLQLSFTHTHTPYKWKARIGKPEYRAESRQLTILPGGVIISVQ